MQEPERILVQLDRVAPGQGRIMEENVTFQSAGHTLAGVLHIPDGLKPGERRAAVIVLHGFGGTMAGPGGNNPGQLFCDMGYVAFRFDFRGCGQSEGERGRIICLEEVEDARNALSYLAGRPEVVSDAHCADGRKLRRSGRGLCGRRR